MPSINKIHITGFKAFPNDFELQLEGKHLLMYGENGSGKSSIYYALHCIFQAPLKSDIGKKYFNVDNEQHLKNVNNLTVDSKIIIDFTDNHPWIYRIDKDGYNTELLGGVHPLPANINGCFINHQFLFHFFNFRNSQRINLFSVFIKDILPFCKDERTGLHIGEMYDTITASIIKKGRRVHPDYISNIEYFNKAVKSVVENINLYASDLYKKYFMDDGEDELQIRLRYDSNLDKPEKDPNEYWLKYDRIIERVKENGEEKEHLSSYKKLNIPFIGLEISEVLNDGTLRPIPKPQSYFNEAKLTAIALSVRFALLNLDKEADGRFLALDDMLISLDMSNRAKVINFLLKISDKYKIYLFTHDKSFFEFTKDVIKSKGKDYSSLWQFKEVYNNENLLENPVCFNSDDSYTRAIYHYKKFDYPASANYLRKAVEEMISLFPKYISINDDGTTKEKLRSRVDAAKTLLLNIDGNIVDIQQIIFSLGLLLNPLSHRSIDTNIYRTELNAIIKIVPRLKQHIIELDIKEVIAQSNYIFLFMDEDETKKCEIKIKLNSPLYSFIDKNGNRKFATVKGDSIESITIENGKRKAPQKFEYYKDETIENICIKLHQQLQKGYKNDYINFYKDVNGMHLYNLI